MVRVMLARVVVSRVVVSRVVVSRAVVSRVGNDVKRYSILVSTPGELYEVM